MRLRQIPLLFFTLWAGASLSGVEVTPDLRKIDPAVLFRDGAAGISSPQGFHGTATSKEPLLPVFIRLSSVDDALPDQVRSLGGTAWKIHPRIYASRLPADATRYLSNLPAVLYIEPDRLARPLLDLSRPAVSADIVHQGAPPLPRPFRGDGTFVGIVDTGLSGAHPDLAGRIAHTFSFSTAIDPLQDTNGHGTHVAGIAAGDGAASSGSYTGMAPASRLLIGRAGTESFQVSAIIDAIDDLLRFAGATPVAINLSLGLPIGPHDGTSSFETAVNALATGPAGSKRIITAAAGNERMSDEHIHATVAPFGATTADVSFDDGTSTAEVEIWADGSDEYSVTATMGSSSLTVLSGAPPSSSGGIFISNKVSRPPNGDTLISLTFRPPSGTRSAGIQLKRTRNGGTGTVDGYIDRVQGTFPAASGEGTITEPANADAVIAVGAFNTKIGGGAGAVGDISDFSSTGPTRDGRIKPDLAAPGSLIYSARSLEAIFIPIEIAPNDNYVIQQGTSMATAHVTGIASLVWQSNPALTGAQMRERLRRTADLQTETPETVWGYGKANALTAVTETVAGISGPVNALPGQDLTLRADEKSSGPFGSTPTYNWAADGATVSPPTGPSTTFTADEPGNYSVTLTAIPGSPPYNRARSMIHVNTNPVALVDGPASDNVGLPVTFDGSRSSARDSGQTLTYQWVLVSRPTGSSASLPGSNAPNVTLIPDVGGTYEVGLRVDDGLDTSVLATKLFTTLGGSVPDSGGGGGGGCAIGIRNDNDNGTSSLAVLILILFPLLVLSSRRKRVRPRHSRLPAASKKP